MGLSVDARVYADQVSDMIYYNPSLAVYPLSFANLIGANYQGFETTVKYHWGDRSNLILNYSRQLMNCNVTGTLTNPAFNATLQSTADLCASSVPMNSGSVLLTQELWQDVLFSAGFYYQSELQFYDVPNNYAQSRMQRLDLRIAKTFGNMAKSGSGEVSFAVQNVLQDNYTNYSAVPETNNILFDRRAYLSATINF